MDPLWLNGLDPRMSITPQSVLWKYTIIATVDIFKFYNAKYIHVCSKCLLGDDLYNISSLILPDKKKEEAATLFNLIDYPLNISKLVWNNQLCILRGCRSKFQWKRYFNVNFFLTNNVDRDEMPPLMGFVFTALYCQKVCFSLFCPVVC